MSAHEWARRGPDFQLDFLRALQTRILAETERFLSRKSEAFKTKLESEIAEQIAELSKDRSRKPQANKTATLTGAYAMCHVCSHQGSSGKKSQKNKRPVSEHYPPAPSWQVWGSNYAADAMAKEASKASANMREVLYPPEYTASLRFSHWGRAVVSRLADHISLVADKGNRLRMLSEEDREWRNFDHHIAANLLSFRKKFDSVSPAHILADPEGFYTSWYRDHPLRRHIRAAVLRKLKANGDIAVGGKGELKAEDVCLICLMAGKTCSARDAHSRSTECESKAVRRKHREIYKHAEEFLRSNLGNPSYCYSLQQRLNPDWQ